MIMKLVPLLDRSGRVRAWANPKTGWIWNLVGNVFALVAFDGVFNFAGSQIGWWYGDHLRDRYGRVVLSRRSTKIEGLNMPRSEKIPRPPKVNLPTGHPVLRWLSMPPLKRHEWADIKSLFDGLAQIRAYEEKLRNFQAKLQTAPFRHQPETHASPAAPGIDTIEAAFPAEATASNRKDFRHHQKRICPQVTQR
jgi:hypothetical protein